MGDYGLKKNAEGYADPTAYAAITGIQKPGEIWAYRGGDALIIKNHGTFSTILRLVDDECAGGVEVGGRFTDTRMLSYAYNDKFGVYQGKITPGEWETVKDSIAAVLGVDRAPLRESVALKAELDELKLCYKKCDSIIGEYSERCAVAEDEANKCKIQLDLLKQMYSDLMEKFLQRA